MPLPVKRDIILDSLRQYSVSLEICKYTNKTE